MNSTSAAKAHQINNLILASGSKVKFDRWKEPLRGFGNIVHANSLNLLKDELLRLKPEVLLIDNDLPGLDGVKGIHILRKLSPDTKIVVLRSPKSDSTEEEWVLFKAGVRGCCPDNLEQSSIVTLVDAIQKGELWIRRTLTNRLLQELEAKQKRTPDFAESSLSLLKNLTHREYEIALRVKNGESNKQIAYSLDITERTVKSHLTEIFRKLSVNDRLKVALILSEDARQEHRVPPNQNH
jgi:DNA-binding NarL/FixJ family response regulator